MKDESHICGLCGAFKDKINDKYVCLSCEKLRTDAGYIFTLKNAHDTKNCFGYYHKGHDSIHIFLDRIKKEFPKEKDFHRCVFHVINHESLHRTFNRLALGNDKYSMDYKKASVWLDSIEMLELLKNTNDWHESYKMRFLFYALIESILVNDTLSYQYIKKRLWDVD